VPSYVVFVLCYFFYCTAVLDEQALWSIFLVSTGIHGQPGAHPVHCDEPQWYVFDWARLTVVSG
jgi:hypothetical protein